MIKNSAWLKVDKIAMNKIGKPNTFFIKIKTNDFITSFF